MEHFVSIAAIDISQTSAPWAVYSRTLNLIGFRLRARDLGSSSSVQRSLGMTWWRCELWFQWHWNVFEETGRDTADLSRFLRDFIGKFHLRMPSGDTLAASCVRRGLFNSKIDLRIASKHSLIFCSTLFASKGVFEGCSTLMNMEVAFMHKFWLHRNANAEAEGVRLVAAFWSLENVGSPARSHCFSQPQPCTASETAENTSQWCESSPEWLFALKN